MGILGIIKFLSRRNFMLEEFIFLEIGLLEWKNLSKDLFQVVDSIIFWVFWVLLNFFHVEILCWKNSYF